jgi:hypothetical protein
MHASGSFVMVWGTTDGVVGRRFGAAWAPRGAEFAVNTYTTGFEFNPEVSLDASGGFVVVWSCQVDEAGSTRGRVRARRFDATGVPQSDDFLVGVTATVTDHQSEPTVASAPDGSFLVVWSGTGQAGIPCVDVFAQRYDTAGAPQGVFQLNSGMVVHPAAPAVAADASSEFVVLWDGLAGNIRGRRLNTLAEPQGAEFRLGSGPDFQFDPAVAALPGGDLVAVWRHDDGNHAYARGQRFDATGVRRGEEFSVAPLGTAEQWVPAVATNAQGSFVVWDTFPRRLPDPMLLSHDREGEIHAERYDASGVPVGPTFQLNSYTTALQGYPAVDADAHGGFVVAWASESTGVYSGIRGQRFGPDVIFEDGFE